MYDGTPLTAEEAGVRFVEGYKKEQTAWTNRSYLVTDPVGSAYNKQILYGLSGITKVHASDPYSQEIGEVVLAAGERLTICPSAPKGEDSSSAKQESGELLPVLLQRRPGKILPLLMKRRQGKVVLTQAGELP